MLNNVYLFMFVLWATTSPKVTSINHLEEGDKEDLSSTSELVVYFENIENEKLKNNRLVQW